MERSLDSAEAEDDNLPQSMLRGPLILAKMIKDALDKYKHVRVYLIQSRPLGCTE